MDKFKDKLKVQSPSSNKEDIKISYVVKIVKVTGLPKSSYSPLLVSWKRGSKKENSGEVKTIPRDGEGVVDHTINLNATITKTPKGFLEKSIQFTVKEEKLGKKPVSLGSVSVNLAQYAESKTEKTHPFPIQDKSKVVCNLYLSIQSSWLKVNGKSMVKAEGNQKEILQELGKQKISHEGTDYFLQTEQDMSEPDQTDFGHDSDNEDEDHVDFDDDSNDKSNVSTLSRKSSSGSVEKGESSSSSSTTIANGHNRTNSSNSVGSNTTTTTTTTSNYVPPALIKEESEEKDLNAMTADLKIKKYKKQLKTLKSELEKSKSQFSTLSKDRDEKVEEIKRMIDDMENIKDRSKSVGNGVIADYNNQIEQLNSKLTAGNKDIENLKIQLQRERNQSSQDSNQVTVLQNQLLTINSQLDTIRNENTTLNNQIRQLETQLRESSSNKPEELQNALATVQNLHLELNQLRSQLATTTEENRSQFIQLEQERLKSNSTESNVNRVEQEKLNLQQRLEHYERTIHLQLEDFEKEKLKISAELGDLKTKLLNYEKLESELNELKSKQPTIPENNNDNDKELIEARDEILQLKEKLNEKEDSIKSTNDQLIEIKDKLIIKETALIELQDQFEQLKKQDNKELLEARDQIVELKDRLTQKEESFKETENKLEDRAIEISELRDKLAEKESILTDREEQLDQLKQSIENQSSTTPIISDQQELLEARDEIVQLKDKLTAKEDSIKDIDNQLIELKDRLTAKELLFKETEDQLYEKSNEISILQDKISNLEESNNNNNSNNSNSSINELQLKLKEFELNTLDKNQSYEERIEKLELQLKEKQLEVQSLQLEIHNNVKEGDSNDRLLKLEEQYKELQEKFDKVKNKKNTLKVLCSNYKLNIEQLEQKQSTLESSAIANQDGLSDEIDQLKSKLIHQTNENEIIQDENNQLKLQLTSYQDDSISKQNIIKDYQEIISKLEQEKEDLIENNKNNKKNSDNSDGHDDSGDDDDRSAEIEEFKEKIQYQKEKIKALKEDLESKSDEWIDIKIKMEEIIGGKQDEIEKLQQQLQQKESLSSLALPVSKDDNNQSNQILEEEIDQLKSQIKQLQQENLAISSEKQFKVQHLQQELEQLRQVNSASASPRSSIGGGGSGIDNLDDLRKEMEENKNIETSIYWSELDFDRNNIPFCGTNVWAIIDGIGGLGKSQNIRLLNKIVISLEKSFLRSGNDCKFIAYWFSTCCYLLSKCHQAGYTQESANPMKSGIEINVNSFVTPAPEIGGSFIRDLQALNLSIYSKLLSVTEIKLERVLIPSVYLPDSIILEAQKSPIKSSSSSSSTSPLGRTSGSLPFNNTGANSINNLLYILDGIIQFLKEGRIFDSVSNQFLNQIFYFMNAQITNHLLNNPKVCTTTQGLEVKMGVSRLKEWCSATPYKSASQQLDSSLEASNLLVIDKNVFVDIEAIKSIFQKLNLHQIKQLLQSFTPDSLSPDTIPTVLRKALDSNWRQSIDINSLPLLIDQSKKFKI